MSFTIQPQPFQAELMRPVKLKMTLKQLRAINTIWEHTDAYMANLKDQPEYDAIMKASPSILWPVIEKFEGLERKKTALIEPESKAFNIKIKPFEAIFLGLFLECAFFHINHPYVVNVTEMIYHDLNQKLA